jgi:hypothetical protein
MKPVTLGLSPSFGFGDRIGLATTGHVKAMQRAGSGVEPIFPQQSIREMTRTQRTATQVMSDALKGMSDAGWKGKTGADADHLKTPQDVDVTAAAGFTFFTIDPSGEVDFAADNYSAADVESRFKTVAGEVSWLDGYKGKTIKLDNGTSFTLDDAVLHRAAVKYGRAINLATRLAKHIEQTATKLGQPYEIELSVDETPQPTTLAEHFIIADQCLKNGMKLVSLAPRFIGDFEKGVDYKGDLQAFEKSLADHAAIARALGKYKLSLHSGSDKISIYGIFSKVTRGLWHVKTAGTSYLEALRCVARNDEKLFREIVDFARSRYDTDKATYHVSATNADAPPARDVADVRQLENLYLGNWDTAKPGTGLSDPGRQILHCTFGSTLTDPKLGPAVRSVLESHRDSYDELLALHFGKHLDALKSGM